LSSFRLAAVSLLALGLIWLLNSPPNSFGQAQPQGQSTVSLDVLYNFDGKCAVATAKTHCDPAVQDGVGVKVGAVVQGPASDNAFYGATPGGGTHSWGTIFKVTVAKNASGAASATVNVLYDFGDAGATDGRNPSGGLTLGSDGNLYGVTYYGGAKGAGTVFRMARSGGAPTILYPFRNGVPDPPVKGQPPPAPLTPAQIDDLAASFPISPPVLGQDGNLYGVTPNSNPGGGVLYQLSSAGVLKCLHRFKTEAKEATAYGWAPTSLTQGWDGNIYGITWRGGFGLGTIFQFNPSNTAGRTGSPSTIYKFKASGEDGTVSNPVIQGHDGKLYGTTYSGGPGLRGVVFRLTLAGQYTVLYHFGGNAANPVAGVAEVLQHGPVNPGVSALQSENYYLYGASEMSGMTGFLYRLREDGNGSDFFVLDNFNGTNGALPNVTPVLNRADSNLYGIAAAGGKSNAGVFYTLDLSVLRVTDVRLDVPKLVTSGRSRTVVQSVYAKGMGHGAVSGQWLVDAKDAEPLPAKEVDFTSGKWVKLGTFHQVVYGHHSLQFAVDGPKGPRTSLEDVAVTGFIPSLDGWSFANDPLKMLPAVLLQPYAGVGNLVNGVTLSYDGVCEGFAISARDYFNNPKMLPARPSDGHDSTEIDNLILADQMAGNSAPKVSINLIKWPAVLGDTPPSPAVYEAVLRASAGLIQQQIQGGRPGVIDIWSFRSPPPDRKIIGHAVVGTASFSSTNILGVTGDGTQSEIQSMMLFSIYDPNFPGNDNLYVGSFDNGVDSPGIQFLSSGMSVPYPPEPEYAMLKLWLPNMYSPPR
jgi:uncharacterized repeat protein (TIGR03803 family)